MKIKKKKKLIEASETLKALGMPQSDEQETIIKLFVEL